MTATEVGVQLNLYPNSQTSPPANPINLTGATCQMAVQGVYGQSYCLSLIVSSDGTYAYRITQATDFPIGGTYQIQLVADFGTSPELRSAVVNLVVNPSLGC